MDTVGKVMRLCGEVFEEEDVEGHLERGLRR